MEPQLANEPGRIRERFPIHLELNRRICTREITAFNLLSVLQNQRIAAGDAAGESEQEGQEGVAMAHDSLKQGIETKQELQAGKECVQLWACRQLRGTTSW